MSKRISKRVREEAATLCSILACNAAAKKRREWCWSSVSARKACGATHKAGSLAHLAWAEAVLTARPETDSAIRYAEAESLLRCGWTP